MPLILAEINGSVGTLTLNHDSKRNALSRALIEELMQSLDDFHQRGVRAVVLRAHPGVHVWSAGHDITELPRPGRDPLDYGDPLERVLRGIRDFHAPVIALIEGSVWGGACELALCCDIPVAVPTSTFALTPARIGVPYNASGLLRIITEVDLSIVKEMLFTARPISAERALRVGFINHVVPAGEIEVFVYAMAEHITTLSALSIAVIKEQLVALSRSRPLSPETFERIESARRKVYSSHDYREGISAFLEKREPEWEAIPSRWSQIEHVGGQ